MNPDRAGHSAADLRAAGWALALLGSVTLAIVALTTPWRALPAQVPRVATDPSRDFTPAQIARSQAFDAAVSTPAYLSLGLTLAVAGILVATPLGARLVERLPGSWWLRALAGVFVLSAAVEVLRWPLGMWFETYLRDYGLSTQTWPDWSADRLKGFGVRTLLLAVTVLAVIALARRFRRWWIPAALGAFTLTVVVSFAYPVLIEPIFNDFTPMPAGQLRDDLLAMAGRDGVPVEDVLIADASRRTTALNAYVSGFGVTRRIVVYDTLLRAPQAEVELVAAHELGHAKHDDVLYGTLIGGLAAGLGACLLYLVTSSDFVRRRAGLLAGSADRVRRAESVPASADPVRRAESFPVPADPAAGSTGARSPLADPRAVGLIMGLMSLATVLSGPAQNLVSRQIEVRADVHALELTRDPATFVAMQKRLASTNISDLSPDLVEYVLYASHPTSPQRIAMARSWALLNGLPEP